MTIIVNRTPKIVKVQNLLPVFFKLLRFVFFQSLDQSTSTLVFSFCPQNSSSGRLNFTLYAPDEFGIHSEEISYTFGSLLVVFVTFKTKAKDCVGIFLSN